jgi:uncharacterized protein YajQ (UPF0234 family)
MPSFDVVSEADMHEVQNALDQAGRELKQRFDFRGSNAAIERTDAGFKISANSEDRVKAAFEVLRDKLVRRKVSLKFVDPEDPKPAGGQNWAQVVNLKNGIDGKNAKSIVAMIKDNKKLKVTPSIQGDAVRVTGKKRDDLQAVIAMLKEKEGADEIAVALTYKNFRD